MNSELLSRLKPSELPEKEPRPLFFDLSQTNDQDALTELLDASPQIKIIDRYEQQLKEFFVLQNPWLHLNPPQRDKEFIPYRDAHYGNRELREVGKWVYLPWRSVLLHILDDAAYQEVRTARNRNLITKEEQEKYYNSVVGIAGLSVGNSCALSLVLTGGAKHLRLTDPDTLELTNLNRIRGSIADITLPKVYMTARQIYELDPYTDLKLYPEGLTEENIAEFMSGLDIMIDEIDSLGIKIRIRQEAKKRKIPVVMAADNGDSGILDIERHDLDDTIDFFHGRAGRGIAEEVLDKKLPLPLIGKIIGEKIVGYDLTEPRMQKSLLEVGKTLPTWPQLGGAALLNGIAVALAVRKIVTGQPLITDRAVLSLTSWLVPGYNDPEQVEQRKKDTEEFAKKYNMAVEEALKRFGA